MKSIFWTQNAGVNENNSLYIDGRPSKDYTTSEVDAAFSLISKYQLDDAIAFVDFKEVCKKYNLPRNFKFFADLKRGTFLQAAFVEKDDYGRPMPFMVWIDSVNPHKIVKELTSYAAMSGKTVDKSDLNNYIKAWKYMNRKPYALAKIIIALVIVLLLLIIAWIVWN